MVAHEFADTIRYEDNPVVRVGIAKSDTDHAIKLC